VRLNLTEGETLSLFRERKGLTQKDFAKNYLKVSQSTLSLWERDHVKIPINQDTLPKITPTRGEWCRVLRRRLRLTLRNAAYGIGVSHVTIVRMEREKLDPARLWNYLKKVKKS
jgi:DNA-binding XRE family transcriptional regulator